MLHKDTPVLPIAGTHLHPASMGEVKLEGGFWGNLQQVNRSATIPHEVMWLEKFGTLRNFDAAAAGTGARDHVGRQFADSDLYKVLEALSWETGRESSAEMEQTISNLVARALPALSEDGYLGTKYGQEGQRPRYSNMEWGHELYNYGHLIQAAVARLRTGHDTDDSLVRLALTVADHVCDTFGPDGLPLTDGHPEIEPALVELYRATGEEKYLKQAQIFLDRRGHHTLADIEFGRTYFQDEVPVEEIETLHGHAVRALYLASGAIDAAVETGDAELLAQVEKSYRNALARRTYITGGMGSHHQDEAFGADFELPPDRAYCETCSGIGSIMVAWRLLLATGDISLGDVIERTLYNIIATSLSEDGTAFFYANPLHQRELTEPTDPEAWSPRASNAQRSSWFEVSCCPPNVSRTLAQLGAYVATTSATGVQLLQYMNGTVDVPVGKERVTLQVSTDYPNDSLIEITVLESPTSPWELTLRIPAWVEGARVSIDGKDHPISRPATVIQGLTQGARVVLNLPLTPRFTYPDPRIDAVRGCVAVERGPVVYCVESAHQPGKTDVAYLSVNPQGSLRVDGDAILATGRVHRWSDDDWAYTNIPQTDRGSDQEVIFTPYWAWANSGPTTMRIWVPTV